VNRHFHYDCWNCGADNLIYGEPCDCCDLYDLPTEWHCWDCGALNETPDDD
jgi:hypothetical protein